MSYQSIDKLQCLLGERIFKYTKDPKKAAGRALGTLVEIITYYLLDAWGYRDCIAIETSLPEYGNNSITHNVEFTLHPMMDKRMLSLPDSVSITSNRIAKELGLEGVRAFTLLDKQGTQKNAGCLLSNKKMLSIVNFNGRKGSDIYLSIANLHRKPFAMFECKRVGVEEGLKKGPQTIEKAKQGAYVARMTSSLQKIWNNQGERMGLVYKNTDPIIEPYDLLLRRIINQADYAALLADFTLSVGMVSNHGNWFTSGTQNKELRVLSQSYDWLLFLSDDGLSTFISELLLSASSGYEEIRKAFLDSYKEGKKANVFTKSKMDHMAHQQLHTFFRDNTDQIERWFNVISPEGRSISELKEQLDVLRNKNWEEIIR